MKEFKNAVKLNDEQLDRVSGGGMTPEALDWIYANTEKLYSNMNHNGRMWISCVGFFRYQKKTYSLDEVKAYLFSRGVYDYSF